MVHRRYPYAAFAMRRNCGFGCQPGQSVQPKTPAQRSLSDARDSQPWREKRQHSPPPGTKESGGRTYTAQIVATLTFAQSLVAAIWRRHLIFEENRARA